MIKLETSEALGRKIRKDDPVDLAKPDWDLFLANKTGKELEFIEYTRGRCKANNDSLASFAEIVLTYLARFGEEHVYEVLRQRYFPRSKERIAATRSVEEMLQISLEAHRGHDSKFRVTEERDRYVVRYDPCGTGGNLRRTRIVGVTSKPYPWSWGKPGVPYYCCHCAILWEIIPIELQGYPSRINIVGERPDDPCISLFYKKPELIPEEYFTRVGKTKTIK